MGPVRDGIQGAVHKDFIHSLTRRSFANPNTPFFQVFMAGLKRIMHFHLDMGPLCPLTEDPDQVQLIHSDTQRKTIKNLGQEQNRYKQVFPLAVCCTCSKQRCPARRGTTWHDVARRRFKCVARPSGDQDVPRSEPRPMERMPEIHQPLGLLLGLFCTSNSQRRFRNFRPRFGKSKSHDAIKGHSIEQPTRTKQQFVRFALSSS